MHKKTKQTRPGQLHGYGQADSAPERSSRPNPLLWAITAALAVAYVLDVTALCALWHPPFNPSWLDAVLLALAVISAIIALLRQLPASNVLAASLLIALFAAGVEWLNLETGMPFGAILPAGSGPLAARPVTWVIPFLWLAAILNSRGTGRLILRPWRKTRTYGFRLIGLTAVLAALFDFALEPFAEHVRHYWFWEPMKIPSWQGAPMTGFFTWAIFTALILVFVTPLLIAKQLSKRRGPDFHPLALWLGAIVFFGAGCAIERLWVPAAADAAIVLVAAAFAIRGALW